MKSFLQRFGGEVLGVLSGFDRLRFRGTKRFLANARGLMNYLWQINVLIKEYGDYAQARTELLARAIEAECRSAGRPFLYLPDSRTSKEDEARAIAQRDGVADGLIAVFRGVELCQSFEAFFDREAGRWALRSRPRKCLHYYRYFNDPELGFGHVRLQSWFPFTMHLCLNGRDWLTRQLTAAGLAFTRRGNCVTACDDFARAQALLDAQLRTDWPKLLGRLAAQANPAEARMLEAPAPYYWSIEASEWATDVLFRSKATLAARYPQFVRHALERLGSRDLLRYLGRKAPLGAGPNAADRYGTFAGEVVTDFKERREGIRVKHRVNANSLKMYDKQATALRIETTLNQPGEFKVWRPKEGDPGGPKAWRQLRKGVADTRRRAEVCQRANERYLDHLATTADPTPLKKLAAPLCAPANWKGRRARALNPLGGEDAALLAAVNRGEFALAGFRNRDLRGLLFAAADPTPPAEARRQSAAVTRKLRLLRAHGLIKKIPHTHRYLLTARGRHAIPALLAARQADAAKLHAAA